MLHRKLLGQGPPKRLLLLPLQSYTPVTLMVFFGICLLIFRAHRTTLGHAHTKLSLQNIVNPVPILFDQVDNLLTIFSKLKQFISEAKPNGVSLTPSEEVLLRELQSTLSIPNAKVDIRVHALIGMEQVNCMHY